MIQFTSSSFYLMTAPHCPLPRAALLVLLGLATLSAAVGPTVIPTNSGPVSGAANGVARYWKGERLEEGLA